MDDQMVKLIAEGIARQIASEQYTGPRLQRCPVCSKQRVALMVIRNNDKSVTYKAVCMECGCASKEVATEEGAALEWEKMDRSHLPPVDRN